MVHKTNKKVNKPIDIEIIFLLIPKTAQVPNNSSDNGVYREQYVQGSIYRK